MKRRIAVLTLPVLVAVGVGLSSPSVADAPLTDSKGVFAGEARVGNTLTSEGGNFNTASDANCTENIAFQGSGSYTVPEAQIGRYVFAAVLFGARSDCVGPITAAVPPPVVTPPAPAPVVQRSIVDIYRVNPVSGEITTNNTVSFYAIVTVGGQKARAGTPIVGYAKGTKVADGKVNSQGKVKLVIRGKLPKGNATLKAELAPTATVAGSSDSVKVKVVAK